MTKPMAKGANHLATAARQRDGAAATGRSVRCLSHGSTTSEKASRPAPTMATMANNSGQRVVRTRLLRKSVIGLEADQRQEQPEGEQGGEAGVAQRAGHIDALVWRAVGHLTPSRHPAGRTGPAAGRSR